VSSVDLTHHFLISMPSMADPNFSRTLTYICEHNDQGALGIVINRPIALTLAGLFEKIDLKLADPSLHSAPVYYGGPVQQDRGFVLHWPIGEWKSTLVVRDKVRGNEREAVGLTTSRDILEAVCAGAGPEKMLVSLGYAGWGAGQLEHEIAQNAWLTVEASEDIIFGLTPETRLAAAMELLGIDFARLQDTAGHA
jgi:putative transcriptional regulator